MTERAKQTFEGLTVSFRFILPILFGGYLLMYNHDREITEQQFQDIKVGQEKIWTSVSLDKNKIDCIQSQLAKCCKDSTYCV